MAARQRKVMDERQDTIALITGTVVVGTFISLMANMIPVAMIIAIAGVYAAKRVLSAPIA